MRLSVNVIIHKIYCGQGQVLSLRAVLTAILKSRPEMLPCGQQTRLRLMKILLQKMAGQEKNLDYSYRYFQTYVLFNCILIDTLDLYKYDIKYEEECLWSKRKKERIILLNGFVVY